MIEGRRHPEDRDDDPRSDIEQIVQSRADEARRHAEHSGDSPLEDAGSEDGVGGTAGVNKAQDAPAGSPTGEG